MRIKPGDIWTDLQAVRERAPLVHNITNYVAMEHTANSLLAIGASPVMSHAIEEIEDMAEVSQSLVLNIGTLSSSWIQAMLLAVRTAKEREIPIVFDPVGCGATPYRTRSAQSIVEGGRITAIKGNASEISSLNGEQVQTKGVDSTVNSMDCIDNAKALAAKHRCIVVVSGPTDVITDGRSVVFVHNGHFLMGKLTGMGCTASALMGAFLAVNPDRFSACIHTMCVMGIAGEVAAQFCTGTGSFKTSFLDSLYNLSQQNVQRMIRAEAG